MRDEHNTASCKDNRFCPALVTSLPAQTLAERGDGVCLTCDVGDMVAGLLEHALLATHRAAPSASVLGGLLDLLFPCHAEQPGHPILFEHEVNRLHERRFVSDVTFPPPSGGVRAASLVSAWRSRVSNPAACWVAGMGERTTSTRSLHVMSSTGAQQVLSNS